jgi:hypothetical protein
VNGLNEGRCAGPARWRGRAGPGLFPGTRSGVRAAVLAGTAVLAAACGSGAPAGPTAHLTVYQRELAYAECMRAHGLPSFPDPQSDGTFDSNLADRGDFAGSRYLSANKACGHLEGPQQTAQQFQQDLRQALRFAACMRAHGIANFQASARGAQGGQVGVGAQGADPSSPQFQAAQRGCSHLFGGGP